MKAYQFNVKEQRALESAKPAELRPNSVSSTGRLLLSLEHDGTCIILETTVAGWREFALRVERLVGASCGAGNSQSL